MAKGVWFDEFQLDDKCKYCREPLMARPRPDIVHYGEARCSSCNKFDSWIAEGKLRLYGVRCRPHY